MSVQIHFTRTDGSDPDLPLPSYEIREDRRSPFRPVAGR